MAPNCCVPKCTQTGGFVFPKDKDLKRKWQVAIKRVDENKRLWQPSEHSIVCHKHFKSSDFVQPKVTYGEKRRKILKAGSVPSVFPFRPPPTDASERTKRYNERKTKVEESYKQGNNFISYELRFFQQLLRNW